MKIHLIKKETIEEYARLNAASKTSLMEWLARIKYSDWKDPADIKATFNSADLLGNGTSRVVFNIAGNGHRLICMYWFGDTRVHLFVKWIGTHAEYTKLCKSGKQYNVDTF
jgi:mRNA interferase HigB